MQKLMFIKTQSIFQCLVGINKSSFEIRDGILYTKDDVKKMCPSTPSSLGLIESKENPTSNVEN
jgi:hypothetical protein